MNIRDISPIIIIILISILRQVINSRKIAHQRKRYKKKDIIKPDKTGTEAEIYYSMDYEKVETEHKKIQGISEPKSPEMTCEKDSIYIKKEKSDNINKKRLIENKNLLIQGIIMSEILGSPRSKNPYKPKIRL